MYYSRYSAQVAMYVYFLPTQGAGRLVPSALAPTVDLVTGGITRVLLRGDCFSLLDYTIVTCGISKAAFVKVDISPSHGDGHPHLWIKLDYLHVPGPIPGLAWKHVSDDSWQGRRLSFHPKLFHAYVHQADIDDYLPDRDKAVVRHFLEGAQAAVKRGQLFEPEKFAAAPPFGVNGKSYTYVALCLGPWIAMGSRTWRLHITIAYLPLLPTSEYCRLLDRCEYVVYCWITSHPIERPWAIIGTSSRGVYVGDDQEAIKDGLLTLSSSQVERSLESGKFRLVTSRIDPICEPAKYAEEVRRLYRRDSLRLKQASTRAEQLRHFPNSGVQVSPCGGLGAPRCGLDVRDLCYYLQDVVTHWPGAQWTAGFETINPCILDASAWHISRHEDWELVTTP